jgi:predicted transcriptional regulator YdeE
MQKTVITLPSITLFGLKTRTSNKIESNPDTSKIPICIQEYFSKKIFSKISNRKNSNQIFSCYNNYESDYNGEYDYFFGKEVTSLEDKLKGVEALTIPTQTYIKFTSEAKEMPKVCIDLWQKIWKFSDEELGGKRSYIADFEIYDERANDPENTVLDIYIGIK